MKKKRSKIYQKDQLHLTPKLTRQKAHNMLIETFIYDIMTNFEKSTFHHIYAAASS